VAVGARAERLRAQRVHAVQREVAVGPAARARRRLALRARLALRVLAETLRGARAASASAAAGRSVGSSSRSSSSSSSRGREPVRCAHQAAQHARPDARAVLRRAGSPARAPVVRRRWRSPALPPRRVLLQRGARLALRVRDLPHPRSVGTCAPLVARREGRWRGRGGGPGQTRAQGARSIGAPPLSARGPCCSAPVPSPARRGAGPAAPRSCVLPTVCRRLG